MAAPPPSLSVSKIPDAWVAGKPLQLTWVVRQHGVTPLHGLKPTIEARSGSRVVSGATWEFSEDGQRPSGKRMPNPGLREKDITPLIAFINAERRVPSR